MKFKDVAFGIAITLITIWCFKDGGRLNIEKLPNLPHVNAVPFGKIKYPAIIQLIHPEHGFMCSATVFDAQYAVTAAHCLVDEKDNFSKLSFFIKDNRGNFTGIMATPAAINRMVDYAIVKGNFSEFQHMNLNVYGNGLMVQSNFTACGFPFGQKKTSCLPFVPTGIYFFMVRGIGALMPGMSGGPVIDVITNEIVGVNSAVGDREVYISPLTGLLGAFEIE